VRGAEESSGQRPVVEGSGTVALPDDLGLAMERALDMAFERSRVEIRPPLRQFYYGDLGIQVRYESAGDGELELAYFKDDGRACDLAAERRRLALSDDPPQWLGRCEVVDATTHRCLPGSKRRSFVNPTPVPIKAGAGQRQLPFEPQGPGDYFVEVRLRDPTKGMTSALDQRCIHVHEPPSWFRVEAAMTGEVWAPPRQVGARTGGYLGLSWLAQTKHLPVSLGLFAGYGFASLRASAPPSWDDLSGSDRLYDGDELTLRWERHSILLSPFLEFHYEPKRHDPPCCRDQSNYPCLAAAFFQAFVEIGPVLDIGFLSLAHVPTELATFRGSDDLRSDVDVNGIAKHGISFRLANRHLISLANVIELVGIDDLALSNRRDVGSGAGLQLGGSVIWGYGP
jgi:hypothetical protein